MRICRFKRIWEASNPVLSADAVIARSASKSCSIIVRKSMMRPANSWQPGSPAEEYQCACKFSEANRKREVVENAIQLDSLSCPGEPLNLHMSSRGDLSDLVPNRLENLRDSTVTVRRRPQMFTHLFSVERDTASPPTGGWLLPACFSSSMGEGGGGG